MDPKETEQGILHNAVEVFRKNTGNELVIEEELVKFINKRGARHEADAVLRLKDKGIDKRYVVEIKKWLTKETLGVAVQQLNRFPEKGIVVAPYINPNMADRLKDMEILFLDMAGNAYFNEPPIFIFIKGNRPNETQHKKQVTRAFQTTGLKVLFALICNPELIDAPYREIAKDANVALGNIGWILNDLTEKGYVVDLGEKGRRLVERKKLINRWVEAYPEQLKPKLFIGRYKPAVENWWLDAKTNIPMNNKKFEVFWGGEPAAARLTNYLKPELYTAYIKGNPNWFVLENKLKKDPQGTVELLKVFWDFEIKGVQPNLAPPLLVYADLLATSDARNIEAANIIYEKDLTGFIEAGG